MVQIDVAAAQEILNAIGCHLDPVFFRGEETTPNDLVYGEHADRPANRLRIEFWRGGRYVKGTLADMVKHRLGVK